MYTHLKVNTIGYNTILIIIGNNIRTYYFVVKCLVVLNVLYTTIVHNYVIQQ